MASEAGVLRDAESGGVTQAQAQGLRSAVQVGWQGSGSGLVVCCETENR